MRDEHATIEDVARLSGVSMTTVSRVMHHSVRVSPEARARVLAAVEHLGYTPNALARGLAMSTTRTVGVLVSSVSDPFWGEVVQTIQRQARQQDYGVLIAASDEDVETERQVLELFLHKRVDGIIVGASSGGTSVLRDPRYARVPLVFVNNEHFLTSPAAHPEPTHAANLVASDDRQGGTLAVEHLLSLGHRHIAYIGPADRASSLHRRAGYAAALEYAGVVCDPALIETVGEGANPGELATFRLLAHRPRPTAIFCYDDMTAVGALRAVRALQLRVPTDISVMGFDDILLAAYLDPPLTTVRQPTGELGEQAVRLLLDILAGGVLPRVVTVHGELVVRDSTGRPPRQ